MSSSKKLVVNQSTLLSKIQKTGTLSEIEFARESLHFKKIKEFNLYDDHESNVVGSLLSITFTKAANLAGVKSSIDQINKDDIAKMVTTVFSGMSIEEIDYAFQMERYGQLGEKTKHFDLFNADYVSNVLNKYRKWLVETRFKKNIPISRQLPEQSETLKKEDQDKIVTSGVIRCFETFKSTGTIDPGFGYVYDYFYEMGVFPKHDNRFREKIRRKAARNIHKRKDSIDNINGNISKEIIEIKKGNNPMKFEKKRIVLITYFNKLINTNTPLKIDVINPA